MLKKTVVYEDFDGNEVTEDLYFHMTKAELIEWETTTSGPVGMDKLVEQIIKEHERGKLVMLIKDLIMRCYGEKDPDGKHFIKSKELSERFTQTPAYDQLFTEFFTNPESLAEFTTGVLPKDLAEKTEAMLKAQENA